MEEWERMEHHIIRKKRKHQKKVDEWEIDKTISPLKYHHHPL